MSIRVINCELGLIEENDKLYHCEVIKQRPIQIKNKQEIKDLPIRQVWDIIIAIERIKNKLEEDYYELGRILSGNCNNWSDLLHEQNEIYDLFMKYKDYERRIWEIIKEKREMGEVVYPKNT